MPDQAVWKLDAKSGALIWTYKFNSGYSDGLETVAFAPDGSLYVGGFAGASIPANDLRFKSAGQVLEGRPFVGKISAEDANGSSAPIGYEWLKHFGGDGYKGSAKALRVEAGTGNIVAVAGSRAAVLKFSPAGDVLMKTGELEPNMQVMDIDVHPDGGYMLGGLRFAPEIAATMLKIGPDGTKQWVKTYGNYPGGLNQFSGLSNDNKWVIDECWGLTATTDASGAIDGYAMACGTGIETAEAAGSDPRLDWRSLVISFDLDGNRRWSRMDSY